MTMMMSLGVVMTSYSLMMCGWRRSFRYWISRLTRPPMSIDEIFRRLMIFIATRCPVMECVATGELESASLARKQDGSGPGELYSRAEAACRLSSGRRSSIETEAAC